jgi:glycosyltransferase involved in cell wall biosynthesis
MNLFGGRKTDSYPYYRCNFNYGLLKHYMKEYPKVIGFVPAYNAAAFIEKTLEALSAQQYPNFEIWICDDASSDNTLEICQKYAEKDVRFKAWGNVKNLGWFKTSQNLWLSAANESDFCFTNPHDDLPYPNFISELASLLITNPDASLAIPGMENEYHDQTIHSFYTHASGEFNVIDRTMVIIHRNKHYWWAPFHGLHRSECVLKAYPISTLSFGEKEFSLDLIAIMKMGFYGQFVTSDKILFKKVYRKKSVSAEWSHGLINRLALWLTILKEIRNSPLQGEIKSAIFKKIISLGFQKLSSRISLSPK